MFGRNSENDYTLRKIERLYDSYKNLMYKEANNILNDECLAEDAVQQSFIKIIKNIDKIDDGDESKTKSFLGIICRNTAIDLYKKRLYLNNKTDFIDFGVEEDELKCPLDYNEPSKIIIDKEAKQRIAKHIGKLPPIYKDIIVLENINEKSKQNVAEILGINYETVRKRSLRARQMLAKVLEKEDLNWYGK